MCATNRTISPRLRRFTEEVNQAREIAKGPSFFWRRHLVDPSGTGEFQILRRWNSHTPSVSNVMGGGGYFLWWSKKGTVIDPGCNFFRILQGTTDYGLGDIHLAVATHDHIDHCQDFGTLITLFRQFNKWGLSRPGNKEFPKTLDLIMSLGAAAQFGSLLTHPENTPFLRWGKVLPHSVVTRVQEPPSLAAGGTRSTGGGGRWPAHLRHWCAFCSRRLETDYGYGLTALPTRHRELLGDDTGMGLKFSLRRAGERCCIVISGDTGLGEGKTQYSRDCLTAAVLTKCYGGCDLLVLHVGTVEKPKGVGGLAPESEHLGLNGTVALLLAVARRRARPPKAVVLTEWGYELGRLGLDGRAEFCRLVIEELSRQGCHSYFAAVGDSATDATGVPVIPADVGLRFRLPDLHVWCETVGSTPVWVPPARVRAVEFSPGLVYLVP